MAKQTETAPQSTGAIAPPKPASPPGCAPMIVVYGESGVGKTTLVAAPNIHIVDCEGGADYIAGSQIGVNRSPILATWPEIQAELARIARGELPANIRAIAIDTGGDLADKIAAHVQSADPVASRRSAGLPVALNQAHGGFGAGSSIIRGIVMNTVMPTIAAIRNRGLTVIVLAHCESRERTTGMGVKMSMIAPMLPGMLGDKLIAASTVVANLFIDADGSRKLRVGGAPTVTTKSRVPMPDLFDASISTIGKHIAAAH